MTLHPRPIPGQHIDGVGEIFAARKADPFEQDDTHLYIIVYKADGQYHAAIYNLHNGLHEAVSYTDCGDAFTDYGGREYSEPSAAPNPYVPGEGLGTPEHPTAPVSSQLLAVIWAGFGFRPTDAEIAAVILDETGQDTRPETLAYIRSALTAYARTENLV